MNEKIGNGVNMPMKRDRFITSFVNIFTCLSAYTRKPTVAKIAVVSIVIKN